GFRIEAEARNGHEALIKLQTYPIDLLITDIRMPIIDGMELLEKVITKEMAPCVVLMSEHTEFEYARNGLVLGAFDYLIKPVIENDIAKLLERAKKFLVQKKKEETRLKSYDPSSDIKRIVELIKEGKEAEELAELVFDKIEDNEGELLNTQTAVQKFRDQMSETLYSDLPWLSKIIEYKGFESSCFTKVSCMDGLREIFVSDIRQLGDRVKSITFRSDYGSMILQASTYVLENVDSEINLSMIAASLHLNKNYLCEIFKQKTGVSLLEYITKVKMERAKVLLGKAELKSYEVADRLAYRNAEYFSKIFKKYTGLSPTEYRSFRNNDKI
ncbi:MAG: response regulator, partial [Bacillota bacterium]|nr:response regulator [Bacillota bacterium]